MIFAQTQYLPEIIKNSKELLDGEDLSTLLQKLAIAIFVGALIGLEREHSKMSKEKTMGGIRTFPLIALIGFLSALIANLEDKIFYFPFVAGFIILVAISYFVTANMGRIGITTEITSVITFILGSLIYWDYIILAAGIGVLVTIILSLKIQLHSFVGKLNENDIYATLKFALITVIILPILPDTTIDPLNVVNLKLIWLLVILVSGISFIGYIILKFYGREEGIPVTGLIGGMVSSTAVTYSFSKKSKENPQLSDSYTTGILLATTLMYPRVFFIMVVLNGALASALWIPLLILTLLGLVLSYFMWKKAKSTKHENIELTNPFELKSALMFGLIFAVILFLSKGAQDYLGEGGVFVAASLGGLSSVDAIVLSLAQLSNSILTVKNVLIGTFIAIISNTLFKCGIVYFSAAPEMRQRIFKNFYIILGMNVLIVLSLFVF